MHSLFSCIRFVYLRKEENRGVCSVRPFNHDFALNPGLIAVLVSSWLVPGEHSGSTAACVPVVGSFWKAPAITQRCPLSGDDAITVPQLASDERAAVCNGLEA